MNKYLLIGTVAILVIAGGWWYFGRVSAEPSVVTRQDTNVQPQPTTNNQQNQTPQNPTPKTVTFKVYFGKENDPSDPTDTLCAHAVARTVPYTSGVAHAALVELFKGPTVSEKQQGYYSCFFHTDIVIKSLKIENGIATTNFSKEYTEGCGGASSCSQAARNAVKNTLTQFPSIKSVQILIEGAPEGHDA
ncbi:MAG: GerMN domain-containing protein [bacterium]|nr:GerMN domain-containing protein [bacterium]